MITVSFIKNIIEVTVDFLHVFNDFGMSNTKIPNSLSFIDDEKFIDEINNNSNICGVITRNDLKLKLKKDFIIESDDPRFDFYTLLNAHYLQNYKQHQNQIDSSAQIHNTAYISEYNVSIGANTIIEPNVTIMPDVEIGNNCIIRAGSIVGGEGFEQKVTSKGILSVLHSGKVIIKDNVIIGGLNSVAKGFSFKNTVINDFVRTDNLVHIAHAVSIKECSIITAGAIIAGSVEIGKNVWIGPNATVSNGIKIGNDAFITLGAVVTKNVPDGEKVTGNFAMPHEVFIRNFKKTTLNV